MAERRNDSRRRARQAAARQRSEARRRARRDTRRERPPPRTRPERPLRSRPPRSAGARTRTPNQSRSSRAPLLLLLLPLVCLFPCDPEEQPEAVVEAVEAPLRPANPVATAAVVPPPRPAPPVGRSDRPQYTPPPKPPPSWVAAFRIQVAARGPRLAECFERASRPGSIRWSAAVEPLSGEVSDHEVAPTLGAQALTRAQRMCVVGVLEQPAYRLQVDEPEETPSRVGVVIEF